jgi:hypothetical protein
VEVPHAVAEWIVEVVAFLASIDTFIHAPPKPLEQKQYGKRNLHFLPW